MNNEILILSPFFFPEPISTGKYNTYLARALQNKGAKVSVAASHPLFPDWRPVFSQENLEGVRIFRGGKGLRYPRSSTLRRVLLETWFAWHAFRNVLRLRKTIKAVIPVFPPSLFFLPVHWLLPRDVKRVGIVHDLQGIHAEEGGGILKHLVASAVRVIERRAFAACDKLIFLSETMARRAVRDYDLDNTKIGIQYPFVAGEFLPTAKTKLARIFPDGFKHVVYSGALGEKQAPEKLLGFFQELISIRGDVMCHIFSRGPLFQMIREQCGDNYGGRISFHDLVDEADLSELYQHSLIQIIPQKENTAEGSLPSKLPNLLAAGVPIFAITDEGSELSGILLASGIGTSHHRWELEELVETFCSFLEEAEKKSHSQRRFSVAPLLEEKFNLENVVREVLSFDSGGFISGRDYGKSFNRQARPGEKPS